MNDDAPSIYPMRYAGQNVVVTGAARGIGFAIADRMAREGASIVVVDIDQARAADAASRLAVVSGASATGVAADVSDARAVEAVMTGIGDLDVLVNNAGVVRDNLLVRMTDDDWDTVIGVHLRGAFLMSRAATARFIEQRRGSILNVSSVAALGNRGQANYAAAKMGIQGLTRSLAIELGPFGVRVNAVAPGFVASDMTAATAERLGLDVAEFQRSSAAQTPVRRIGQPSDIAAVAAFLCSEEASFVTGQTVYVDGGLALGLRG